MFHLQKLTLLIFQKEFWFPKFARLILSVNVWFSKWGRLILRMMLLISKFAAFDFSYNIFYFQNLSRLISQMAFVFPKWERYGSHPRDSFWDRGHTQSTVTSRPNKAETECFSDKEGMCRWKEYGFKEPSREEKASHFFTLSPKRESPFTGYNQQWSERKQNNIYFCNVPFKRCCDQYLLRFFFTFSWSFQTFW